MTVGEKNKSSVVVASTPTIKNGKVAMENIQRTWAERASQRRQKQLLIQTTHSSPESRFSKEMSQENIDICRIWKHIQKSVVDIFAQTFPQTPRKSGQSGSPESKNDRLSSSSAGRERLRARIEERQRVAAVAAEVESMKLSSRSQNDLQNLSTDSTSDISILPASYSFSCALSDLANKHSRAFLLLDLAAIVSAHVNFFHLMSSPSLKVSTSSYRNKKSQALFTFEPQFDVHKNRDHELLKLLIRLRVGLRCSSKDDVFAVRKAIQAELHSSRVNSPKGSSTLSSVEEMVTEKELESLVIDDAKRTRKPDGYLKTLFGFDSDIDINSVDAKEVAVDGPDEIMRTIRVITKFQDRVRNRRKQRMENIEEFERNSPTDVCHFILRLPKITLDRFENKDKFDLVEKTLREVFIRTHEIAASRNGGRIVGISLDLSQFDMSNDNTKQKLSSILLKLRLIHIFFSLYRCGVKEQRKIDMRIDLSGLPQPLTKEYCSSLTDLLSAQILQACPSKEDIENALEGTSMSRDKKFDDILKRTEDQQLQCNTTFTVDASYHLVARAGGLCTRIIGARKVLTRNNSSDSNNTESSPENKPISSNSVDIHYFIDDGCYGSLSGSSITTNSDTSSTSTKSSSSFLPIPLYANNRSSEEEVGENILGRATVWGPTCDGLDRVCESVMLPLDLKANEDWLIFPNLGCGGFGGGLGLGTAFNGFDPPDTAYCVLGYFSNWSKGVNSRNKTQEKQDLGLEC